MSNCRKDPEVPIEQLHLTEQHVTPSYKSANITGKFSYKGTIKSITLWISADAQMTNAIPVSAIVNNNSSFNVLINNLNHLTKYYYNYEFNNGFNVCKSDVYSFITLSISLPIITTNSVTTITGTQATCGGNITFDGGTAITARGVCWSTSQNPTISNSHTTNGTGSGNYSSVITGLQTITTYYVRAYATNEMGTSYGAQRSFTTTNGKPIVTTNVNVSSISTTNATSGGNVTSDGGFAVTSRGVCWGTSINPTTANPHTINGNGTGSFTSYLTGLSSGTNYYVRAYATNSKGTSYGTSIMFTTTGTGTLPSVTTDDISHITHNSAMGGGSVINSGSTSVTAKGVCWSTSPNPTIANSHSTNGTGTGSFSSWIGGLIENDTYYVRAYATNNSGTAYGSQKLFTTTSSCSEFHEDYVTSNVYTWSNNNGYVAGTNNHQYTAFAEYFANSGTKYVKEIHMDYIIEGSNGYITINIYNNNNGNPGTVLYSLQYPMSTFYTYATYNSSSGYYEGSLIFCGFSQAVTGNFFIGIDITNTQSGFALYTSSANTYANTGFLYKSSTSSWYTYTSATVQNNALSLSIRPVVCQNDGRGSRSVMIKKGNPSHQFTIKEKEINARNR